MRAEIENLEGTSETFIQARNVLRSSLGQINSLVVNSSLVDLVPELQNLAMTSSKEKPGKLKGKNTMMRWSMGFHTEMDKHTFMICTE